VEGCSPYSVVACAQTADMQIQNLNTGVWDTDGDGVTKHGCAGAAAPAIKQNTCHATGILLAYRTIGIFVVIDSLGDTATWDGPSGVLRVIRIC